jgi:hypothetical protein
MRNSLKNGIVKRELVRDSMIATPTSVRAIRVDEHYPSKTDF